MDDVKTGEMNVNKQNAAALMSCYDRCKQAGSYDAACRMKMTIQCCFLCLLSSILSHTPLRE